ncbi:WASH complex subunit 2 [Armigeres subalbatus]|uniref:WASH complex subunit 2 n=1 Tax=Armigeres subalbatus TaxID=124917 RepID=UPI002ED63258
MALTPDELRKRIPQWSLESDGQLLQYMSQISKNLEEKCKQTQDNLNLLLMEIDESHIRFANASNNFNGIQQHKYVENRVQDDDESFYSVREEEEEKGEKLPYGEIFQMTVEKSIANMYTSFEKVTVQLDSDSDSEDDEEEAAARNTVLRAVQKYPYISRPLPHIIGSQEWREKWHAGLIDSEEESDTEPKEQYSDSSDSERMFPSQTNSNHTPSESEGSVWGVHSDPRRRAASIDPSVSGDDAFSIHSSSSAIRPVGTRSGMINPPNKVPVLPGFRPPSLFPDKPPADDTISVSSRSKVANLFEESDDEDSTPTHKPAVAGAINTQPTYFRGNQAERKTVNLFSDEPPPSSHEPTPSSIISSHYQKKPVNLFIDSDEDDSFNNNYSSRSSSIYQSEPPELSKPSKKSSNLFDDDDDNSDVTPKATAAKMVHELFDKVNNNEGDDEDDLFVPVKRSINGATESGKLGVQRITNLFDDEPPEDDFDQIFKPKAADRKIPGAKLVLPPILREENQKETIKKEIGNNGPKKQLDRPQQSVEPVPVVLQPTVKKKTNLFDEDDDETNEIFSTSAVKQETKQEVVTIKPKINLFDDDIDESPQIIESNHLKDQINDPKSKESITSQSSSIRSAIIKKKSIFDTDSNEDDEDDFLFGGKRSISNSKTKQESLPSKVEPVVKNTIPQNSLETLNDTIVTVKSEKFDGSPSSGKESPEKQIIESESKQVTSNSIRSEILKKKSMFESDSSENEEDDYSIGTRCEGLTHLSTTTVVSEQDGASNPVNIPTIERTKEDNNSRNELMNEEGHNRNELMDVNSIVKVSEKPQIPEEPPDDSFDHMPNYPEVSNDIDYYLTTNKIDGPSESSKSITLVQSNNSDSNKEMDEPSLKEAGDKSELLFVEPPDINDLSNKTSILQDSENNDVHIKNSSSNNSALNFNSIGLFDDIPPPDDCFEESRTTLLAVDHTDDGFYSAGPKTIPNAIGTSSVNTNQYLFMDIGDGPPPDDDVDDAKTSPTTQESAPFKNISSIIGEGNKNESSSAGTREIPKINRLSAKVNINVNALLPGVRRPQPPATAKKATDAPDLCDVPIPVDTIVNQSTPNQQADYEAGPSKLVSLNKGRARIQTKRKPQSRQNRKSNYENSLASGTVEDFINHHPTEQQPKEEVRVVVGSEERTQHVEIIAGHVQIDQLLSSDVIQKLSEPKLFDNNTDTVDKLLNIDSTSRTAKIASITPVPKNMNPPVKEPVPKATPKPPSSAKLFSDDDSDDDDLFGKISKPIVAQNSTVVKHEPDRNKPIQPAAALSTGTKKQSLFGDSDEDDDLFAQPQSSAKLVPKPIGRKSSNDEPPSNVSKTKKSIFGSEGDSDSDDIFGGSKKGATTSSNKGVLKEPKASLNTSAVPPRHKSLFGEDDDDDDDLFSSRSKPASKPTSSQPVTTTKQMYRNPTTSAKTTIDDPLADLLK